MNQCDELLRLIRQIDETIDGLGEWHDGTEYLEWVRKEVQRIMNASRPQVVESVEELEALPTGAVIRSADETIYEASTGLRGVRLWFLTGSECEDLSHEVALPATVLYTPQEAK